MIFLSVRTYVVLLLFLPLICLCQNLAPTLVIDSAKSLIMKGEAQKVLDLLATYERTMPDSLLAYSLFLKAISYSETNRPSDAKTHYEQSLELDTSTINKVRVLNGLATLNIKLEKFEPALAQLIQVHELLVKQNRMDDLIKIYGNMAIIFHEMGNYKEALNYKKKILREEAPNDPDRPNTLLNLAATYMAMNESDSAIYYLQQAVELASKTRHMSALVSAHSNVGMLYQKLGDCSKAIHHAQKASALAKELNIINIIINSKGTITSCLFDNQEYEKAKRFGMEALSMAQEFGRKAQLEQVYLLLHRIDSARGNFAKSLEYFKKSKAYTDSLRLDERSKTMAKMKTQFETELKDRELKLVKVENQLNQEKVKQQKARIYLLLLLILLLVLAFFLAYLQIQQRKKKELNELAKAQDRLRLNAIVETQEQTRKQITKDLHDGVGQTIAALNIRLQKLATPIDPESNLNDPIDRSLALLDTLKQEIRSVSYKAMPYALEQEGLTTAIQEMLDNWLIPNVEGIQYHFDPINVKRYPENLEINVFRIIQELTSNAVKHASASLLTIQLYQKEDWLIVTIEDNGIGFDLNDLPHQGMGLMNIRSRANMLNGTIAIESTPGEGALFILKVPI